MKHTRESMQQFAVELAQLLEKYDICIYWSCGEGSDTYGIYDERMVMAPRMWETDGMAVSIEGSSIDANSLRTEEVS